MSNAHSTNTKATPPYPSHHSQPAAEIMLNRADGKLIFRSNEDGFRTSNVVALCDISHSDKIASDAVTGRKGIGFKSVFVLGDRVTVRSNHFRFSFDVLDEQGRPDVLRQMLPSWIAGPLRCHDAPRSTFASDPALGRGAAVTAVLDGDGDGNDGESLVVGSSASVDPAVNEEAACGFRGTEIEVAVRGEVGSAGSGGGGGAKLGEACDWAAECRDCLASTGVGLGFLLASRRLRSLRMLIADFTGTQPDDSQVAHLSEEACFDGSTAGSSVVMSVCEDDKMQSEDAAGQELDTAQQQEAEEAGSVAAYVSFEAHRVDSESHMLLTPAAQRDIEDSIPLGSITRTPVTLRVFSLDLSQTMRSGLKAAAGETASSISADPRAVATGEADRLEFVQYNTSVELTPLAWSAGGRNDRAAIRSLQAYARIELFPLALSTAPKSLRLIYIVSCRVVSCRVVSCRVAACRCRRLQKPLLAIFPKVSMFTQLFPRNHSDGIFSSTQTGTSTRSAPASLPTSATRK